MAIFKITPKTKTQECQAKINGSPWQRGLLVKAVNEKSMKEETLFIDDDLSFSLGKLISSSNFSFLLVRANEFNGQVKNPNGQKPEFLVEKLVGVE